MGAPAMSDGGRSDAGVGACADAPSIQLRLDMLEHAAGLGAGKEM